VNRDITPVVLSICSVDSRLGKNCPEQYSELAKVDDVDYSAGINAVRKLLSSNIAKSPPLSPYDYGWRKDAAGPT
jgi:hypothetical protein